MTMIDAALNALGTVCTSVSFVKNEDDPLPDNYIVLSVLDNTPDVYAGDQPPGSQEICRSPVPGKCAALYAMPALSSALLSTAMIMKQNILLHTLKLNQMTHATGTKERSNNGIYRFALLWLLPYYRNHQR